MSQRAICFWRAPGLLLRGWVGFLISACLSVSGQHTTNPPPQGYYHFPALHGDTLVFTAEGDLWKTSARGGVAQRLTKHPYEEAGAVISPDGQTPTPDPDSFPFREPRLTRSCAAPR